MPADHAFSSTSLLKDKLRKILLEGLECSVWTLGELPFIGKILAIEENILVLEGEDFTAHDDEPVTAITYVDLFCVTAVRYTKQPDAPDTQDKSTEQIAQVAKVPTFVDNFPITTGTSQLREAWNKHVVQPDVPVDSAETSTETALRERLVAPVVPERKDFSGTLDEFPFDPF